MPRKTRCRRVEISPGTTSFVPLNKRMDNMDDMVLTLEELEAMRLKDIEGLTQQECAERMEISRQTFQNIIDSARKKVAVALINGLSITIKGGYFKFPYCEIECRSCHAIYSVQYPQDRKVCPICNSSRVYCNNMHKCYRWCEK